jgi:hypothetical protein
VHLIGREEAESLALGLRLLERGIELSSRRFRTLQQAHPGRDHLGHIPIAARGDGLGREALQFRRQGLPPRAAGGFLRAATGVCPSRERQARYRARREADQPALVVRYRRPVDRRSRLQRWHDAVAGLLALQAEYAAWCDALPDSLRDSATAAALQAIVDLDLDELATIDAHSAGAPHPGLPKNSMSRIHAA